MLVWGGAPQQVPGDVVAQPGFTDGAAYSPTTLRWRRLAASPLPYSDTTEGVWAGDRLIVAVAIKNKLKSAAYDPRHDRWQRLSDVPVLVITDFSLESSGREVALWATGPEDAPQPVGSGALLGSDSSHWKALPQAPRRTDGVHVFGHSALLTRTGLYVWSGESVTSASAGVDSSSDLGSQGLNYSLLSHQWRAVRSPFGFQPPAPSSLLVWTGRDVIAYGGLPFWGVADTAPCGERTGTRYDPHTNTFTLLPTHPVERGSGGGQAAWLNPLLAVVNQTTWCADPERARPGDAALYSNATNSWIGLPSFPPSDGGADLLWAGQQLILWGGFQPDSHKSWPLGGYSGYVLVPGT